MENQNVKDCEIELKKDERTFFKKRSRGRVARRRHGKTRSVAASTSTYEDRQWTLHSVLRRRWEYHLKHGEGSVFQTPLVGQGVYMEKDDTFLYIPPDDIQALYTQLGFVPGNAVSVSARLNHLVLSNLYPHLTRLLCRYPRIPHDLRLSQLSEFLGDDSTQLQLDGDTPIVLMLYPLALRAKHEGGKIQGQKSKSRKRCSLMASSMDNNATEVDTVVVEPFPTIYWLTHPVLKHFISQLEVGDRPTNVSGLEQRLVSEPTYLQMMKKSHLNYSQDRMNLITPHDWQTIITPRKWDVALGMTRGVAGITKPEGIKCLHAHVAHYLAKLASIQNGETVATAIQPNGHDFSQNLIGQWTMEALEEILQKSRI